MEKLRFKINDWVTFIYERKHIYIIQDIRAEREASVHNPNQIIYFFELIRQKDGFQMEAEQEELLLIHRPMINQTPHIFDYYTSTAHHFPKPIQSEKRKEEIHPIGIDQYLDVYNDYRLLYQWFGDQKYLNEMKKVLNKMKTVYR